MINPYKNVDWNNYQQIISTNHWHCETLRYFRAIVDTGLQHFALSNYDPSTPTYPLNDNDRLDIPKSDIPEYALESPNTEMVRFANISMHINSLGSFHWNPGHNWDKQEYKDIPIPTWKENFTNILNDLQYADGGGIVIAHPIRNRISVDGIIEKLRYDDRVLGCEVMNHRSQRQYNETGYFFDGWDKISSRGIRCFGFFAPDEHANFPDGFKDGDDLRDFNHGFGRNVMLTTTYDSHDVLKAYRNGEFYGALYGDRIRFTNIEFKDNTFYVESDNAERIEFISWSIKDGKKIKNDNIVIDNNSGQASVDDSTIFIRAIAYEDRNDVEFTQPVTSEKIFTQPIILKTEEEIKKETPDVNKKIKHQRLLLFNGR